MRQIGFADLVVLNKVDLVSPEHVEVIRDWIGQHLHRIRIIEATRCDVPLEVLLAVGRFDPAHAIDHAGNGEDAAEHHEHGAVGRMFQTWSYESDRPFALERLRHMVRKERPLSGPATPATPTYHAAAGRRLQAGQNRSSDHVEDGLPQIRRHHRPALPHLSSRGISWHTHRPTPGHRGPCSAIFV